MLLLIYIYINFYISSLVNLRQNERPPSIVDWVYVESNRLICLANSLLISQTVGYLIASNICLQAIIIGLQRLECNNLFIRECLSDRQSIDTNIRSNIHKNLCIFHAFSQKIDLLAIILLTQPEEPLLIVFTQVNPQVHNCLRHDRVGIGDPHVIRSKQ